VEGAPTEESDVEGEPGFIIPEKGDNAKPRECMRDLDDLLKLLR
jgi:hypothetical protein